MEYFLSIVLTFAQQQTPEDEPKSNHNLPYVNILSDASIENVVYDGVKLCESKSKENVQLMQSKNANNDDKVIVTTARPATVISNFPSQSNGNYMTKEERYV